MGTNRHFLGKEFSFSHSRPNPNFQAQRTRQSMIEAARATHIDLEKPAMCKSFGKLCCFGTVLNAPRLRLKTRSAGTPPKIGRARDHPLSRPATAFDLPGLPHASHPVDTPPSWRIPVPHLLVTTRELAIPQPPFGHALFSEHPADACRMAQPLENMKRYPEPRRFFGENILLQFQHH